MSGLQAESLTTWWIFLNAVVFLTSGSLDFFVRGGVERQWRGELSVSWSSRLLFSSPLESPSLWKCYLHWNSSVVFSIREAGCPLPGDPVPTEAQRHLLVCLPSRCCVCASCAWGCHPLWCDQRPPHVFNSYWNMVDYSVSFCCTAKWISYIYIYIYISHHSLLDSIPI